MKRTVRQMRVVAFAACCIVLLVSVGCVQKKRIYSEPAHYDHGTASSAPVSAPAQAGTQSANLAVQQQELPDQKPLPEPAPAPAPQDEPAAPQAVAAAPAGDVGMASWIADDFQGLRTASGELYDKDALTASHRTLPMNTRVEVTNLENGRFTVVRINDRGPFKKDRIIDVSRRAAEELGMISAGLAKVRLRVLEGQGAPSGQGATEAAATKQPAPDETSKAGSVAGQSSAAPSDSWYVQVGAFQDRENAKNVLAGLYSAGYGQSRISRSQDDGLYRVQAGSFGSRADAEAALETLKPQYPAGYVINSGSVQP